MVGKVIAMRSVFRLVSQVAPSRLTVLIRGRVALGKRWSPGRYMRAVIAPLGHL